MRLLSNSCKKNLDTVVQVLRKYSVALSLVIILILSFMPSRTIGTNSNILYVNRKSPLASTTLLVDNLLTVKIGAYSSNDSAKGSAYGSVTYPTDMLQVINTDSSGTEFQTLTIAIGNGNISFYATRSPSSLGLNQLFLITFKMIKSGNATIGFGSGSIVDSSTTSYVPETFSISSPTPIASPSPSPSSTPKTTTPVPIPTSLPSNTTTIAPTTSSLPSSTSSGTTSKTAVPSNTSTGTSSSTSTQSTTQNKSTAPKILGSQSNIANIPLADTSVLNDYVAPTQDTTGLIDSVSVDPQYSKSNLTWKINANDASSRIEYGTSSTRLDKSAPVTKKDNGTYASTIALLNPGVRYYYNITASGGGRSDSTYSGVFTTRGYPVSFTVTENNSPIESAQIKIGTQTYVLGSSGKKTIGLAAGRYSVTVTTNSASETKDIAVEEKPIPADGSAPENQAFSVNLSSSLLDGGPGSGQSILSFIGILVGGAVVLGIGFALFIARRRHQFESEASTYSGSGSNVVIDDGYSWRKNDKP